MRCWYAFIGPLIWILATGRTLRFPIVQHAIQSLNENRGYGFQHPQPDLATHPAEEKPSLASPQTGSTPLIDIRSFWSWGIEISVGTPGQPIRALLDIDMDTFYVQSARYQTHICEDNNQTSFDSSESRTYNSLHRNLSVFYLGVEIRGVLSEDFLQIGDFRVPQRFVDAMTINPQTWFTLYGGFNSVLGLAPGRSNSRPDIPTPWQSMVKSGLLERNVFSVLPPTGPRDFDNDSRTNGELILGGVPPDWPEESAITLPLKSGTDAWATTLESIQFGNHSESFDPASSTAYFFTSWPLITLPRRWFKAILKEIDPEHFGIISEIACDSRSRLPNLTLGISGHEITLDALHYSMEVFANGTSACFVPFFSEEDFYEGEDTIGLGLPFLENFAAVLDTDRNEVQLNYRDNHRRT